MEQRIKRDFFTVSALELAPKLLGCYLCRKLESGEIIKKRITETECYMGEDDTACHASKGKTPRNAPMYEEGGISYIYLCYGIHYLLNVVAGQKGYPEAVLLRGADNIIGPGKLTKSMQIDMTLNKTNLTDSNAIWLEVGEPLSYETATRVGIHYATKKDQDKRWRFIAVNLSPQGEC